jgi:type II secretion system protein J
MKMTEQRTANSERRTSPADARVAASLLEVGGRALEVCRAGPGGIQVKPKIGMKHEAFTLIEVLLAVGIFAIVLFAINTVFFSALKLERATTRSVDERAPLNQALAILRRDLQGAVPPMTNSYLLRRDFKTGTGGGGLGSASSASLEFYTTTGVINDEEAWGDLQKVRYELVEPTQHTNANSRELVRIITRNVLATTTVEEDEQFLAGGIESVEFLCYNGTDWRSTWDTTAGDVGLPLAVRVRIQLARENPAVKILREPLELLVPITTQALTNQAGGVL